MQELRLSISPALIKSKGPQKWRKVACLYSAPNLGYIRFWRAGKCGINENNIIYITQLHTSEISCFVKFKAYFSTKGVFRQSWPELLGHKGNKPVKMTYFLPPPPPDAMLMSGIQVIFGRLNIAWGKGGQKKWFTKTTLSALFKGSIQSFILIVHFRS